jgi:N-acyl-D-aspartate/D-glutamate deacylase
MSLEQAVHKITGFGQKLRLNRGLLQEGLPADITVFDADKIDDLVSKKLPATVDAQEVMRHPPGMKAVVVGATVEDGHCNDVSGQSTPPATLHQLTKVANRSASPPLFSPSPSGRGWGEAI